MSDLRCPVCQSAFREVLREGILIDVCTQCRGVWLDRGELDKLLELARGGDEAAPAPQEQRAYRDNPPPQQPQPQYRQPEPRYEQPRYRDDDDDYRRREHYGKDKYYKKDDDYYVDKYGNKRKKKSKLEGIMDIFDF
ncbi:zf-TFIIB domain-containing protein [Asticcacaulis machinosus]|uniref:Zf-TFIIB domain-containing protein n=1 Tax=Asticcacaulis machinosus TaxID=2984211 RepID=A0ABT5HG09_9CAUL|nr:zf-TFIIB domain-containing protein [Asticcacaulis machinosus]MDC7675123.1 zf-TFIIB domain-containing protein [Asticcacaulis machinosus]